MLSQETRRLSPDESQAVLALVEKLGHASTGVTELTITAEADGLTALITHTGDRPRLIVV